MAQVYTLDVIASEKGVTLSEDEQKKVAEAARTYLDGLEDTERDYIGLSEKRQKNYMSVMCWQKNCMRL